MIRDSRADRVRFSERLGIIASVTILISSMVFVETPVHAHAIIWTTGFSTIVFAVVPLILAVALLMRVILTGEWSDTSWF